jgi:NTE family protein
MGRSINNFELREADVVMRPKLNGVSSADFSARKRSIQAGRDITQAMLVDLKNKILAKTR